VRDDDILIIEDEQGRLRLTFVDTTAADQEAEKKKHTAQVGKLLTGMIVALLGEEQGNGDFFVREVILPGLQPQKALSPLGGDSYVAVVSGLSVGHPKYSPLLCQLMADYITGLVGNSMEQNNMATVVRLIVAGNTVAAPELTSDIFDVRGSLRPRETASLVLPMKHADILLSQIASSLHVDLMPGDSDPCNNSLPQQPIFPAMLPKSSKYSTMHLVTNPYDFAVHGVRFLGTSGQNLHDVRQYTTMENPIEMLQTVLEAAHIAPTAPDTLDSYPFTDRDPFVIKETPHVFFAGNQAQFEAKLWKKQGENKQVLLLSVPSFISSPALVLINLRTLDAQTIAFGGPNL